ncbi:Clp1/GlmU family protein [Geoglobus acetivorans]|uniref:polynucleotide 5'-hydroxyl-kinase n=1 Tax=Geoglobus acetivorans TaxID=565033 RepID=A0A0A7GFG4_GEOAI|nr:hypothetical protein GACE_0649 [Geoglobus acetivorans]
MRVEGNTTILLFGPGRFESSSSAHIFGGKFREAHVERGKILPLYFPEDAEVKITGDYVAVSGSTIPESWRRFSDKDYGRIFLFGESDSGKSSFAAYVMNTMGVETAIDADVGQNDIAHPGAMGMGVKKSDVYSLQQLEISEIAFAGVISPSGFESRCLRAFTHLVKRVKGRAVVDTTGWVKGWRAREYKLSKIEAFEPDVVACFGQPPYYLEGYETITLESFVVKKRDRNLRASIRGRRYEHWLSELEEVEVCIDDVKTRNTSMLRGYRMEDDLLSSFGDVVYAEKGFDFLNIYSENFDAGREAISMLRELYGVAEVNIVKPSDLRGLFLGLFRGNRYLSPGILKDIDFEERKIKILGRKDTDTVEFGSFRLDEDLKEILVRVP